MKRKKVAIITLYGEINYGNKLQNCAVQHCFEKWGYDAQTITPSEGSVLLKFRKIIRFLLITLAKRPFSLRFPDQAKRANFEIFTRKHSPTRTIKTPDGKFGKKTESQYDFFVTGSDQVWNYNFFNRTNNAHNMLLSFAPSEKKFCFSPSFGISEINDEWKDKFRAALCDFSNLCSREQSGVEIIKELTGREDVFLTIDPTLMLDSVEWMKYAKKVPNIPENYVFEYFLGALPKDNDDYISAGEGLERVRLLDLSQKRFYCSGPSEFIYLLSMSKTVCTDSFHACVFAILFSKPVVVFKRQDSLQSMFTRMETLFKYFDIDINEHIGKPVLVDAELRDRVLKEKRTVLEKNVCY